MLLQVHDELLFEVPAANVDEVRGLVRERMEAAAVLDVPLRVEGGVGTNWLEAK
jgi:DNA polymerase-1